MQVKTKINFIVIILTALISFYSNAVKSQTRISSPYSRYGIGDLYSTRFNESMGIGGISQGVRSNTFINSANPASYTALDSTSFLLGTGLLNKLVQLNTTTTKQVENYASINYLTFAFPICKWMGASIGLLPYSNTGYNLYKEDTITSIGRTVSNYEAYGGINQVYIGTGFKILKNLSIGLNGSYIYGNLNKTRTIVFPDSLYIFGLQVKDEIIPHGALFNFGIQYQKNLKNDLRFLLGGTFSNKMKINASNNSLSETFAGVSYLATTVKDTIYNIESNGQITLPTSFTGGFTLAKNQKWSLGADYNYQKWSEFSTFEITDSLIHDSYQLSFGGQITPNINAPRNYLNRITYKIGGRYGKNYLELKNTPLNEYGITFGFGLPLKRSKSTINIGVEVGQKGTTTNDLIKENFVNFSINFSIYERWFIKHKYD